jgi:hypothetical protein
MKNKFLTGSSKKGSYCDYGYPFVDVNNKLNVAFAAGRQRLPPWKASLNGQF